MKVNAVVILVATVLLVPGSARVGAEEPSPQHVEVDYRNGFSLTSADGRFQLRLNAAAQFRYTWLDYDDAVRGNETDYSNFYLRRARLWLSGHAYDPRLSYVFHVQLEPNQSVNLLDAWVSYRVSDLVNVGFGRNKIPYGTEFLASGFSLQLVERSIFTGETDINAGELSHWPGGGNALLPVSAQHAFTGFPVGGMSLYRSQGVSVSGRAGGAVGTAFRYEVGIWNGRNSRGQSNSSDRHLVSARAHVYPWGAVDWTVQGDPGMTPTPHVGFIASAYTAGSVHTRDAGGAAVPAYHGDDSGLDLSMLLRWQGLAVDAEWARERYSIDRAIAGPTSFDRSGWRASVGYFVVPRRLEVVARHARLRRLEDPTPAAVSVSGLGFVTVIVDGVDVSAIEKELAESTVGATLYLAGPQLKVSADVSRLSRSFALYQGVTPDDQQDFRVRSMVQVKF